VTRCITLVPSSSLHIDLFIKHDTHQLVAEETRNCQVATPRRRKVSKHKEIRLVIIGLGNIGRRFLQVLYDKADHLRKQYRLSFRLVGAADSGGAAIDPAGLDLRAIVALKEQRRSVAQYPDCGQPGLSPLALVRQVDADVLCEASPVDLERGEPGLSCIRAALGKGMHVVTPNKGPLVLAYAELTALAKERGRQLLFCGTVAGGLPALNLGRRDLAGATIHRLEALPNLTTSFILDRMTQGQTYDQALAAAQAQGCAEADPTLDVDGWDAALKLVILANSVLGVPTTLDDVHVQGITGVTQRDLQAARDEGKVIKLVATAERLADGTYQLAVAPTPLPAGHPLARLSGQQMGIVYDTDIYGVISAAILEEEPVPSAATMLRDLLSIYAYD
jgi:homoserine dehydrogenase